MVHFQLPESLGNNLLGPRAECPGAVSQVQRQNGAQYRIQFHRKIAARIYGDISPLAAFIAEVIEIIGTRPNINEILVQRVLPLRYAAEQGYEKYDQFVQTFNDNMQTETSTH